MKIPSDYILRLLPDTTITFINEPIARVIGQPVEQLIGQLWINYVTPQALSEFLKQLTKVTPYSPGFKYEDKTTWEDGKTYWTQWINQGVFNDQGELTTIQCFGQDITHLKQAELDLQKSERQFQSLAANLPVVIYQVERHEDGSDFFTYISPGIKTLCGLDPKAIESDATLMWKAIHPDDISLVKASVMKSAQSLTPWVAEFRIRTTNGELKWICGSSAKPTLLSSGTIVWDGFLIDVSNRIQAEFALHESQERYASLARAVPVGIFRTDIQGKYIYVNDQWSEMVGLDVDAALGQSWLSNIHLHDREFVSTEWYSSSVGERTPLNLEFRIQQPSSEVIWVYGQVVPEYNSTQEIIGYVGTITDITHRKSAERVIQTNEERYRLLAENSNDLVCLLNRYGRFIYVSPSSKSLLGCSHQELIGASFFDFLHIDDCARFRQELSLVESVEISKPITARMKVKKDQKTEEYLWFETLAKPIFDQFGQVFRLQMTSRNITDRIHAQEILKHDALHDTLTGLPNRNLLMERLELSIQRAKRRADYHFAVLFLDLDRFKVINDSLGHLAGDKLLICMAEKLRSLLRSTDVAARLGGDEFVILLEDVKSMQQVVHIAERVFAELRSPINLSGRDVFISTSIGIVWSSPAYTQPSELLRDADTAMYCAKSQGQGRYQIFDHQMHTEALKRLNLEHDLRQAIKREEFVVYYQPIISLDTSELVGFEALVRWQHPYHGLIYPAEFIEVAEEMGLIMELDRWVLTVAGKQLVNWQATFPKATALKMSVNLSAQDLWNETLIQDTTQVLEQTGIQGQHLILEITESMLIGDIDKAAVMLNQLKNYGIQISIDDFGTGYASLSHLHRLPIDILKIDRSFVKKMQENQRNYKIIETIITLSRQLNIHTVAEGIETCQQLDSLQQIGCNYAQGYLFSKPLSADAATALLEQNQQTRILQLQR